MAFEKTLRGTRGPNMPSFISPAVKFMNNQMIRRFRRSAASGNGKTMGMDGLVLTTVGAKTGQRRQTLLGTFPDGDGAWLIIASAGGQMKNPAWYHNLAAHPDQAQIEVGGKTVNVTATQLAGQERDAAWQRITTAQPRYAGYEKKTDRVMPVIRLTASSPQG
ncbi:MAG: nitroreductase family deazaflavin-dependent oxidoreductase [Trebonia sp.]